MKCETNLVLQDASAVFAILNRDEGYESFVRRIKVHKGIRLVTSLARFEMVVALARKKSGKDKQPSPSQYAAARPNFRRMLHQYDIWGR